MRHQTCIISVKYLMFFCFSLLRAFPCLENVLTNVLESFFPFSSNNWSSNLKLAWKVTKVYLQNVYLMQQGDYEKVGTKANRAIIRLWACQLLNTITVTTLCILIRLASHTSHLSMNNVYITIDNCFQTIEWRSWNDKSTPDIWVCLLHLHLNRSNSSIE